MFAVTNVVGVKVHAFVAGEDVEGARLGKREIANVVGDATEIPLLPD
jgi:hypothetical protein